LEECPGQLSWNPRMKESKAITLRWSDSTSVLADFKYSMRGKVISITYLSGSSIDKKLGEYCGGLSICAKAQLRSYRHSLSAQPITGAG
jgi:hypothetical protein